MEEYESVKREGVTEEEVARAKALLKTDVLFTRDGAFSVAASVNEGKGEILFYREFVFYQTWKHFF